MRIAVMGRACFRTRVYAFQANSVRLTRAGISRVTCKPTSEFFVESLDFNVPTSLENLFLELFTSVADVCLD